MHKMISSQKTLYPPCRSTESTCHQKNKRKRGLRACSACLAAAWQRWSKMFAYLLPVLVVLSTRRLERDSTTREGFVWSFHGSILNVKNHPKSSKVPRLLAFSLWDLQLIKTVPTNLPNSLVLRLLPQHLATKLQGLGFLLSPPCLSFSSFQGGWPSLENGMLRCFSQKYGFWNNPNIPTNMD